MDRKKFLTYISAVAVAAILAMPHASAYINHKVKSGETLWGVAYKYGITADELVQHNPHASNGLKKGMALRIPEKADLEAGPNQDSDVNTQSNTPSQAKEQAKEKVPESVQTQAQEQPTPYADLPQETAPEPDITPIAEETTTVDTPVQEPIYEQDSDIYIARFGDTLHSVSMKTGISETRLLAFNPLIDTKHIPEGYPVRLSENAPQLSSPGRASIVDSIICGVTPAEGENLPDAPLPASTPQKSQKELTVAIMLPFDVDSETISRQSLLATDFYKGFLLAAKDALDQHKFPLKIIAIDTQCDEDKFSQDLDQLMLSGVSIIIPPDDETQLEKIESTALAHDITVINALNIKDEGYLRYPNVVQCNINQKIMYDKAIMALMTDFEDYTPVILDLSGGKDEKLSFIEELRRQYSEKGLNVIDLPVKSMLSAQEISTLPESGKYVFIPKSGSSEVFTRISDGLQTAINENYFDEKYKVFGYPDWITFKGEQEEALHNMGAKIYSRFFMDPADPASDAVNKDFVKWYGYQMEEVYPSQGMLGYDIGRMIFSNLKETSKDDIKKNLLKGKYSGAQSSFKFVEPDDSGSSTPGLINDVLYIIEFLPGTATNASTI